MSMSKKHFISLAELVRDCEPIKLDQVDSRASGEHRQWELMRDLLADFCRHENSNFKRDRWLSYIAGECGPNGGAVRKGGN